MGVFINFSNHPHDAWKPSQTGAALRMADGIEDIPFPNVDPEASEEEVRELAERCVTEILSRSPAAVMAQGEFTLCYHVVRELLRRDIPVFAACTKRVTTEKDGVKLSRFSFVKFRDYRD